MSLPISKIHGKRKRDPASQVTNQEDVEASKDVKGNNVPNH